MAFFDFSFEAVISRHLIGKGERKLAYTVVMMPEDLKSALPLKENPRLRIQGEIADHPFKGAWQPAGGGEFYLMVPKPVLKGASLSIGDEVEVRFSIDDPEAVDIPAALAQSLQGDAALMEKWQALSPGKQRGFAYRVASAKTDPTIAKRIEEVTHMVRAGLSYGKGGRIK